MAKILVTETVSNVGPDLLKAHGHEVIFANGDTELIKKVLPEVEAVLVRIVKFPGELLATAPKLKIVSKHGVGFDNIDTGYCKAHGIAVTTTPNANSLSVSEHAFALMVSLAKNLFPVANTYREQGFAPATHYTPGVELTGKTLGLIGSGRIGGTFAGMCSRGFGMKVLAYDPYAKSAPEGITLVEDMDEVIRQADVLSIHCALTDETRKMINAEKLSLMKKDAILINCARGPIIDEPALIEALEQGKIRAAGLDVTDPEPVSPDSKLFRLPNVIVTPHYAPNTVESLDRVSRIGCENIAAVLNGAEPVGRIV